MNKLSHLGLQMTFRSKCFTRIDKEMSWKPFFCINVKFRFKIGRLVLSKFRIRTN